MTDRNLTKGKFKRGEILSFYENISDVETQELLRELIKRAAKNGGEISDITLREYNYDYILKIVVLSAIEFIEQGEME